MASHLRTLRGGKVSFFLFMDTITAVTAMLIMVSLMMTLYMGDTPVLSQGRGESVRATLEQTLARIESVTAQNQAARMLIESARSTPDIDRLQTDIASLQLEITNQVQSLAQLEARLAQQLADAQKKAEQLGVGEERVQLEESTRALAAVRQTNLVAQTELDDLKQKIKDLETQLEKTKGERLKLWLIPEADASGKRPLLVSLSATNIVCERFNQPSSRREFPSAIAEDRFTRLLRDMRPDRDYVVFYIRPSGIRSFEKFNTLAKQAGFNVGYDAVEEDRRVVFSTPQPQAATTSNTNAP